MSGIQYCMNCKHDKGGREPCEHGRKWLRNVPISCEYFDGELYFKQKRKVNVPVYEKENIGSSRIKITAYEICNTFNTDWQDHVLREFSVSGNSLDECFRKLYPSERSLRYCSGYRIQLKDPELHKKWQEWKEHSVTIDMYYGSGTVD